MDAEKLKKLELDYLNADGEEKIDNLLELSVGYLHSKPSKSIKFAEIALNLSKETDDKKNIALSLKYLGSGNNLLNNYSRSLKFYKDCLKIQTGLDDKMGASASLNNIAVSYSQLEDNENALKYYLKALDLFEELDHKKGIAACTCNIGIIYKKFGDLDKAKYYYHKSLKIAEDSGNMYSTAAAFNNIGEIYNISGDYASALDCFKKADKIAETIDNPELQINVNNNLGVIYMVIEDYPLAIKTLLKTFRVSNTISNKHGVISSLVNISKCYMQLGNYSTALSNMRDAVELADPSNIAPDLNLEIYSSYTDIYYKMGEFKNAFNYLKKYFRLKSKIFDEKARQNINDLHARYQIDKKEKEAELFRLKNVELKSKNDELRRLNATKNKFFSIIAHDLRNPFHALLGMLNFFSENIKELDSYEVSETVRQLQQSSRQVNKLLENLLSWAQIQTEDILPVPTHFDIAGLIEENVKLLKGMAKSKQLAVNNYVTDDITVFADHRMINSVIQNCITNSIKFTPRGGQITITDSLIENMIEIEIKDNGVGVDEKIIQKLFKEEERVHTQGTEDEKGTGLGLLLSKEFIEKNNGTIRMISKKGAGTSLFITIPLAE